MISYSTLSSDLTFEIFGAEGRDAVCARAFSMIRFIMTFHSKLSNTLTFENLGAQGGDAVCA